MSYNGSAMIYQQVIRPFFLKHQAAMDNAVNDLSSKAKSVSESAAKKGETLLSCIRVHSHDLFEYQCATHAASHLSLPHVDGFMTPIKVINYIIKTHV